MEGRWVPVPPGGRAPVPWFHPSRAGHGTHSHCRRLTGGRPRGPRPSLHAGLVATPLLLLPPTQRPVLSGLQSPRRAGRPGTRAALSDRLLHTRVTAAIT